MEKPKKPQVQRSKTVEAIKHSDAKRKNIPTAEYQSVFKEQEKDPIRVEYARRNKDLDPQLMWRGKDEQDWSDLVVHPAARAHRVGHRRSGSRGRLQHRAAPALRCVHASA